MGEIKIIMVAKPTTPTQNEIELDTNLFTYLVPGIKPRALNH